MSAYDVIVIGSGPGGEGAAMQAAKRGRRVAVIERYKEVGGGCTHWGTIPSKALRHAIQKYTEVRTNPLFREAAPDLTFPQMLSTATGVIAKQVAMRRTFYDRNECELIHGNAILIDKNTVEVVKPNGLRDRLTANVIVVASGSRPAHPADADFTHPRVFDSDTILTLRSTPHSITIYGAGVIGCEYASIFRNLGVKVNLVNTRDKLLAFLDDEISDALSYHLREQGVLIRHNEEYERIETQDDGVVLHLKSGKKLKTSALLYANGRTGNTEGLNLPEVGVPVSNRGLVTVNECYQTGVDTIYAVGDLIGAPSLASAAYDQGRDAMLHYTTGACVRRISRMVPTGIYTSPEISSIGRTERELTAAKVPYEVGHALFKSMARAQITGQTTGMLKLLFHRETQEILGIHCFGDQAAEIIHIGQAIMVQPAPNNTIRFFAETTFNYPTMAEAYRIAALNGLNRLF